MSENPNDWQVVEGSIADGQTHKRKNNSKHQGKRSHKQRVMNDTSSKLIINVKLTNNATNNMIMPMEFVSGDELLLS